MADSADESAQYIGSEGIHRPTDPDNLEISSKLELEQDSNEEVNI